MYVYIVHHQGDTVYTQFTHDKTKAVNTSIWNKNTFIFISTMYVISKNMNTFKILSYTNTETLTMNYP